MKKHCNTFTRRTTLARLYFIMRTIDNRANQITAVYLTVLNDERRKSKVRLDKKSFSKIKVEEDYDDEFWWFVCWMDKM